MSTISTSASKRDEGAHQSATVRARTAELARLASFSLVGLVALRIVTSWNWLSGALLGKDAKVRPDFLDGNGVTTRVHGFFGTKGVLYPWIADFLNGTVVSHAAFFGWLVMAGELVAGICLLLGLFTRLGGLAAALSAILNLMAAAGGGGDSIGQNYLLLTLGIIFMVVPVGRFLGLDAVLQRKWPAKVLRVLG